MEFKDILYTKDGGIARITINRPHRRNAYTGSTKLELIQALHDAGDDDRVGVVVLTGAGDKAFCAGGDVQWEKEGGLREQYDHVVDLHNALRLCLKPVIARINGFAIGGGHHLAYFCDLSIAAEHAIFGQNGPRVGSPADGFAVANLVNVVGSKRAREIWYLCRRYTAQQALAMGLVNAVVPYEQLDEEVDRWCEEILDKSPTCISILKATFERALDAQRESNFSIQRQIAPKFFHTEEPKEGANAFLEKRAPDFRKFRGLPPKASSNSETK